MKKFFCCGQPRIFSCAPTRSLRIAFSWTLNSILPKRKKIREWKNLAANKTKAKIIKKSWMRFLAPENFDTPNNKQGHETGHERRIEEEKCLEDRLGSGIFGDWRIIMVKRTKVPIAQERFTQPRQEIGWCVGSRVSNSLFFSAARAHFMWITSKILRGAKN